MDVLILDGELKSALAAVRSLGEKGITVYCGAPRRSAMSLHSAYCAKPFVYPSPLDDDMRFVDAVIDRARLCPAQSLILAFSDATFLPLARNREKLEKHALFVCSREESMDIAFDKAKTLARAKELGIPVPRMIAFDNINDLRGKLIGAEYPLVVKARHSCVWRNGKGISGTAQFAFSPDEVVAMVIDIEDKTGEAPLVQEYIRGSEYGIEVLCDHGEIVALCRHERMRSLSPSGGASVLKKTIGVNEMTVLMGKWTRDLMKNLTWHGVAMVEFKMNDKEHHPVLMEINGRFWGSLPLAIYAGVDFPYLFYSLAEGKNVGHGAVCTDGVVSRHFLGDVKNLARVFFAHDRIRASVYPPRLAALKNFLLTGRARSDVFSSKDPLPFLYEYIDRIGKITRV